MKKRFCLLLIYLTAIYHLSGQGTTEIILGKTCAIEGKVSLGRLQASYAASDVVEKLNQITDIAGFPTNFMVYSTKTPGISVISSINQANNERIIIYNEVYRQKIAASRNLDWTTIFMIAHEVGHHLAGHTLGEDESKRRQEELSADYFAGFIMAHFYAEKSHVLEAINFLEENPTDGIHPPRIERENKILEGWAKGVEKRCKSGGGNGNSEPKPCNETTGEITIFNASKYPMYLDGVNYNGPKGGLPVILDYQGTIISPGQSYTITNIKVGNHFLYYKLMFKDSNFIKEQSNRPLPVYGCRKDNKITIPNPD